MPEIVAKLTPRGEYPKTIKIPNAHRPNQALGTGLSCIVVFNDHLLLLTDRITQRPCDLPVIVIGQPGACKQRRVVEPLCDSGFKYRTDLAFDIGRSL